MTKKTVTINKEATQALITRHLPNGRTTHRFYYLTNRQAVRLFDAIHNLAQYPQPNGASKFYSDEKRYEA